MTTLRSLSITVHLTVEDTALTDIEIADVLFNALCEWQALRRRKYPRGLIFSVDGTDVVRS
jgi:hypothetical protein